MANEKYVSNFDLFGEIIHVKDENVAAQIAQETAAREAAFNNLYDHINLDENSRFLTVGASGAAFTSINAAITHALTLSPTKANPVTIFIYPGTYTEQIVLNNYHGINFIGCGIDKTIIQYNGSYPNCVVHVQGDYNFYNLTIKELNSATYAVHIDPSDSVVEGCVRFEHCRVIGGTSAFGYGSGNNTELYIKDCIMSANQHIIYAHNSPYPRSGQKLTVLDNLFERTTESKVVLLDDAGYSNAGTVSVMTVVFTGNSYNYAGLGQIQFRKNTAASTHYSYLPENDTNIKCGPGNDYNAGLPGLNFGKGNYEISTYAVVPSEVDGGGTYQFTIPTEIYTPNYNCSIENATIPGVGDVTNQFSITGSSKYGLNISTANAGMAGRGIAFSIRCITL